MDFRPDVQKIRHLRAGHPGWRKQTDHGIKVFTLNITLGILRNRLRMFMAKTYRVTYDNSGAQTSISGWELVNHGISTMPLSALTSELILLEAVVEE